MIIHSRRLCSKPKPYLAGPLNNDPATCFRAALWLGLVVVCGCHQSAASNSKVTQVIAKKPIAADIVDVVETAWPTTVRTQGSLAADERAVIGAEVAGRVAETLVELGTVVHRDQPLARLEMSDFDLRIQQAEAFLAEACVAVGLGLDESSAQLDAELIPFVVVEKALWDEAMDALERLRRLRKTNAVSQSEFDKQVALTRVTHARYESALRSVEEKTALIRSRRVELAQARQDKEDATIRAPFDGVIQQRHLAAGTFLQRGAAVVTMVRIDPLRFQGRVPERKAAAVRVGQTIQIHIEGEPASIQAVVVRTSPSLDIASRSLQIEAEIPNPDGRFRSGLFAEGYIEVDSDAKTRALPTTAVGEFAGVHKVWVEKGQLRELRRVEVGRRGPERIEILSGLEVGERVLRRYTDGESRRRGTLASNE